MDARQVGCHVKGHQNDLGKWIINQAALATPWESDGFSGRRNTRGIARRKHLVGCRPKLFAFKKVIPKGTTFEMDF